MQHSSSVVTPKYSLKVGKSYNIVEHQFLRLKGTDVLPYCFCNAPMIGKGNKIECAQGCCPLVIDKKALQFFIENNYVDFNSSSEEFQKIQSCEIPVCSICENNQSNHNKPMQVGLLSYLAESTKKYPSYQGIIWRCACPNSIVVGSVDDLKKGWKTYGPQFDQSKNNIVKLPAAGGAEKKVFNFAGLYKKV